MKFILLSFFILSMSTRAVAVVEQESVGSEGETGLLKRFSIPISFEVEVNDSSRKFVFYKTEYFTEEWALEIYTNDRAILRSKRGSSEVLYQAAANDTAAKITISAHGVASLSGIEHGVLPKQTGRFLTLNLEPDSMSSKIILQPSDQKLYTLSFSITE